MVHNQGVLDARLQQLRSVYPNEIIQIPPNYVVAPIPAGRKPPEVRMCRLSIQGRGARPHSNVSEQLTRNGRAFLSLPSQNLRHSRLRWACEQAWRGHRRVVRASHTPKRPTSRTISYGDAGDWMKSEYSRNLQPIRW